MPLQENLYYFGICQAVRDLRLALPENRAYLDRVLRELERFGEGKGFCGFSFALVLTRGRDVQYLDLTAREDSITLTQGGYVYGAADYGDIYGDWSFTLWQNGDFSDACRLDPREIKNLLRQGAGLEIAY